MRTHKYEFWPDGFFSKILTKKRKLAGRYFIKKIISKLNNNKIFKNIYILGNLNKRTKKEAMKIHFNSSFNPKILKLLDSKKKYIHEVTPDITQLAPIDVSFHDLDVEGVKSFLDYGTSLNKLMKKKINYYKSIIKEDWSGYDLWHEKSLIKLGDQHYYCKLFGLFQETTLKDWDKITSIARLMKKKGYKFDEKKLTKFQESNDAEYKRDLKVFKSLIK